MLVSADAATRPSRAFTIIAATERERIALQSHLPLSDTGNRVCCSTPHGYVGLSPVNGEELNVCLVEAA
jgi:hypothetical protein